MFMKHFHRYQRPADPDEGGGGDIDRGDDFTPTDDDVVDDKDTKDLKAPAAKDDKAPKDDAGKDGLRDSGLDEDEIDKLGEGKDDEGKGEKDAKSRKDSRIPLSRHQDILNKAREREQDLVRQLAQYQQGDKVAKVNESIGKAETAISEMETQYTKHLADGELDKAAGLMGKIRAAERELIEQKSDLKIQAATVMARESARYDTTVERVEAAYPALNPDSDDFDNDKATEVMDLKDAMVGKGRTPSDALQRAVKYVMGAPKSAVEKQATEVKPRVDEADLAAKRKKDAAAKAADAIKKTPADTAKAGTDSDRIGGGLTGKDLMNMSHDEFVKVPDAVLSKARGDDV